MLADDPKAGEEARAAVASGATVDGIVASSLRPAGSAGYVNIGREQVYYVLHRAAARRARALLLGPSGSERAYSYLTWRRWGERLASIGVTAVRFDYRGTGESTGAAATMDLDAHLNDALACLPLVDGRGPLVLHGLRFGAVVASELFRQGTGDALLLWDPPSPAQAVVRQWLRSRTIEAAIAASAPGERCVQLEDLEAMLRAGQPVVAEGHEISPALWRDLASVPALPKSTASDASRPVHVLRLVHASERSEGIVIPRPPFWRPGPLLRPDVSELFEASLRWIEELVSRT